jgi:hypothetical protein
MIKAKILFLAALLAITLVSCDLFPDIISGLLEEDSFYALNMETQKYYEVKAEKLYEGNKCVIWAERNAKVTEETAKKIAREYDMEIRPRVIKNFSQRDFNEGREQFNDMLDYANWLAGRNDKKLTILLLDIKDGFKNPETDSYVAGYFSGSNFNKKGKIGGTEYYSNGRDMIYIDTYPGLRIQPRQTYATFAHELQHLINFVTRFWMYKENYTLMDTWIDEGLSSQAEYMYLKENPTEKCRWFKEDKKGTIAQGNNFFVWDNHDENPSAILDDYATVYLFFRWLYLQASPELQSHIFLDIETSSSDNYEAIIRVAKQIDPAWDSWETLLGTWLAANYYPKNSYGYTGDDYLQTTIAVKPITKKTISLYPGEGVYSIINNSFSAETSGKIRYEGLAKNNTVIGTSSPYTGDVLLTFNANADHTAKTEIAVLTGVPVPASQTTARTIQTGTLTGPYVIDARDMLNKNKKR